MGLDFEAVFRASPSPTLVVTAKDYVVVAANDRYLDLVGRKREDFVGGSFFKSFPTNPSSVKSGGFDALRASWESAASQGLLNCTFVQRFDVSRPEAEGGGFAQCYWSTSNAPLIGADGAAEFIIHQADDMTERVRSVFFGAGPSDSDDLRFLAMPERFFLAEWQHRFRNSLAIIRSIAKRTGDNANSVREYQSHFDGRIGAYARVQSLIARNPIEGVDLGIMVAEELLGQGAKEGGQAEISGPTVFLPLKIGESLGFAIHELATNAMKFGALSDPGGAVSVDWSVQGEDKDRVLRFNWTERLAKGVTIAPAARRGFGLELLERSLPYELDAKVSLDFRPEGLAAEIETPLRRPVMR